MIDYNTVRIIERTGMDLPSMHGIAAQLIMTEVAYLEKNHAGQIDFKANVIKDLIERLHYHVYHEHNYLIRLLLEALTEAKLRYPDPFFDRVEAFREDYAKLTRPQFNIHKLYVR